MPSTSGKTSFLCSYLSQPHVLLLDGVLQTVAERPGQQQVGGLPDHVVDLRGAENTNRAWVCVKSITLFLTDRRWGWSQEQQFKFSVCRSPLGKWKCQPIQMSTLESLSCHSLNFTHNTQTHLQGIYRESNLDLIDYGTKSLGWISTEEKTHLNQRRGWTHSH